MMVGSKPCLAALSRLPRPSVAQLRRLLLGAIVLEALLDRPWWRIIFALARAMVCAALLMSGACIGLRLLHLVVTQQTLAVVTEACRSLWLRIALLTEQQYFSEEVARPEVAQGWSFPQVH